MRRARDACHLGFFSSRYFNLRHHQHIVKMLSTRAALLPYRLAVATKAAVVAGRRQAALTTVRGRDSVRSIQSVAQTDRVRSLQLRNHRHVDIYVGYNHPPPLLSRYET